MLSALFGSEARVKILAVFLLSTAEKYSARQLAAETGLSSPSLRRELEGLTELGLIKETSSDSESREKRPTRWYRLNRDCLIYPELRALFTKAQILSSRKFISGLEKACRPRLLALTGFFTNNSSPTDMLLVGNIKRPALAKLIKELERDLGREVNYTIMSEREFEYRRQVMDIFLYNILEGKNVILIDNLHQN